MTMQLALVSDVHGNAEALEVVLAAIDAQAPQARIICAGDVVGYGPEPEACIEMLRERHAVMVMGNHEQKLLRALSGRNVQITHGLAETLAEIDAIPPDERAPLVEELKAWLDARISHYVLDGGRLVKQLEWWQFVGQQGRLRHDRKFLRHGGLGDDHRLRGEWFLCGKDRLDVPGGSRLGSRLRLRGQWPSAKHRPRHPDNEPPGPAGRATPPGSRP